MPSPLDVHFAAIEAEYAEALARPLSARQALLVAVLLDKYADRLYFARREAASTPAADGEDILAFRARLGQQTPALAQVFDLCAVPPRARLATRAHQVPIADYPALSTADFMVSLYNGNTVQRVMLDAADGNMHLAHDTLAEAIDALEKLRPAGPTVLG